MSERERRDGLDLEHLTASDVTAFVVSQCRTRRRGSAKVLVTPLRSLLRFLFLQGYTTCPLAQAVPTATGWADQSLPRALGADAVTALLNSCDRHTVAGMRDFAILTLLARLGLRAGEVAALTLEDIDWHHGEMVVRGKGGRRERLPLPADVGEAVVTHLRHRPGFACRALFLKVRAPVSGLGSDGVQDVVRGACLRAGLPPAGAHRLRHHAATAMLACGASLTRGRPGAPPRPPGHHQPVREGRPGGVAQHRPAVARRCQMSALRQAVEDYITLRRALGSKLERHPRLLESFAGYLEAAGATTITIELALSWARLPGDDANPAYLSNRLCAVRGFARHLQAFDPATEVPPARLLPWPKCRAATYIYSEDDIAALMRAARLLTPVLRAATYESLIGLLSVTGMRVGEGIRLNRDDVDFDEGVLTIWDSKFAKSREVPVHPGTLDALRTYAQRRDELCPQPRTARFFVSAAGTRLVYNTIQPTFSRLARDAGLAPRSERCRPRLHDLRHSFTCTALLGWYREGVDVEAHLPLLSTYLGHGNPSSTYWYYSDSRVIPIPAPLPA